MHVLVAIYSDTAAWTIPPAQVDELRGRFPDVTFAHAKDEAEMIRLIPQAEVVFSSCLTAAAFAVGSRLCWVHSPAAGVGSLLFPAMKASHIPLTNSRGMNARAVAEHAIAMILALTRRLPDAVRAQSARQWIQADLSGLPTLQGRTMGIVGLGAIGSELSAMAHALGLRVIGTRREVADPVPAGVAEALSPAELPRLLDESDIVVLAAPLTAETRGLIGASELSRMKPTAILVNVSRGKLVREAELVRTLQAGTIAGAALDVFEHEPLDQSSPLWGMSNVLITPHVAGFRADYWEAAVGVFSENLRRFLSGRPLLNLVDKAQGY